MHPESVLYVMKARILSLFFKKVVNYLNTVYLRNSFSPLLRNALLLREGMHALSCWESAFWGALSHSSSEARSGTDLHSVPFFLSIQRMMTSQLFKNHFFLGWKHGFRGRAFA